MDNGFFKWTKGSVFTYSTSIASSWIWAPAIFISSQQAYVNGLTGFLMFFLPNFFTLMLFGNVAAYVRRHVEGYTVMDALQASPKQQQYLHLAVYILIVLCSTCTQIIGMQMLLSVFITGKALIAVGLSLFALLLVWKNGLKTSIITDAYKYVIMLVCAIVLLLNARGEVSFSGISEQSAWEMFKSFGAITALGLLSGVYADMTLWQRAFSVPKENVKKCFVRAGYGFAVIPLIFGLIGFMCGGNGAAWSLQGQYSSGVLNAILIICVTSTLMATLDSNLCAMAAVPCKMFGKQLVWGRIVMSGVLMVACILTSTELFSLTYMFLAYNTLRACIAVPTLLIIFNRYDGRRLLIATIVAVVVALVGYLATTNFIFTVLGFAIPLAGYKKKEVIK